jgi:hypothetical protein
MKYVALIYTNEQKQSEYLDTEEKREAYMAGYWPWRSCTEPASSAGRRSIRCTARSPCGCAAGR